MLVGIVCVCARMCFICIHACMHVHTHVLVYVCVFSPTTLQLKHRRRMADGDVT